MRTYTRGLLALALLAGAARADEDPKIAWKFDQPCSQKWTTKVKQTIKATGEGAQKDPVVQTQEVSLTVLWTPAKEKDKKQPLKLKIEALAVAVEAGGEKWAFDSGAEAKAKGPLAEALGK